MTKFLNNYHYNQFTYESILTFTSCLLQVVLTREDKKMTQTTNTTEKVGGANAGTLAATEGNSAKTKAQLKRQRQRENKKKRDKKENGDGGGKPRENKFKGEVTTGVLEGVVVDPLNTNVNVIITQEQNLKEALMILADEKGMQGVSQCIKNDHAPVSADYAATRGNTSAYQTTIAANLNASPPISATIVVADPEAKQDADQRYLLSLKSETGKFEKIKKDMECLYGIIVGGQIHERILALMEQLGGWQTIENNRNLIGMLRLLRRVCSMFKTGHESCAAFDNISALQG